MGPYSIPSGAQRAGKETEIKGSYPLCGYYTIKNESGKQNNRGGPDGPPRKTFFLLRILDDAVAAVVALVDHGENTVGIRVAEGKEGVAH